MVSMAIPLSSLFSVGDTISFTRFSTLFKESSRWKGKMNKLCDACCDFLAYLLLVSFFFPHPYTHFVLLVLLDSEKHFIWSSIMVHQTSRPSFPRETTLSSSLGALISRVGRLLFSTIFFFFLNIVCGISLQRKQNKTEDT